MTGQVELANQAGIVLPYDEGFELLLKPDGSYQVYLLDAEFCKINSGPVDNKFFVMNSLDSLDHIYMKLTGEDPMNW